MKWVFFVLLAANLGLAAFTTVRDRMPNPDAQLVRQQMNADQIQIVAPRPMPAPAPLTSAPGPGVCLEWGSFGAIVLPRAQAALDALALGERVRRTEGGVLTSYWIYIPPLKSRSEMDKKTSELKGRGITEYSPILEAAMKTVRKNTLHCCGKKACARRNSASANRESPRPLFWCGIQPKRSRRNWRTSRPNIPAPTCGRWTVRLPEAGATRDSAPASRDRRPSIPASAYGTPATTGDARC
jgi:hypothetical protein